MGQGSWLSILGRRLREHLQHIVEQPLPETLRNILNRSDGLPNAVKDKKRHSD